MRKARRKRNIFDVSTSSSSSLRELLNQEQIKVAIQSPWEQVRMRLKNAHPHAHYLQHFPPPHSHPRVVEGGRRHEGPSPKSLDSDENFKP